MGTFWQDLRYATRMLLKSPGFTVVAVLTLVLGIGANIAAFSVVNGVVLRPLPFPQSGQLVRIFDDLHASNTLNVGMSVPEFIDLQRQTGIFQQASVVWPINANVTGYDRPVRVETLATSPEYFTLLGAKPQLGRVYTSADAVPGFIMGIVISDSFWHRYFGGDNNVLGKQIRLDSDLCTVIGVMPPDFHHPGRTLETDEDIFTAAGYIAAPFPNPPVRAARFIPSAIARLQPGLSVAAAQAQLNAFTADLSRQYPTEYPAAAGWGLRLVSVQGDLVGSVAKELYVLFAAVGFVLLIACVNLANLLLARSAGRRREIAIRLALGASRKRLISQLLTESLLLSTVSCAVAFIVVLALKSWLLRLAPANMPRIHEINVGGGVLIFAFGTAILTGLLFGLVPALQAANADQTASLREGSMGAGTSRSHGRLSRGLVISEIALSLVLLAGAGLLLRSFWNLLQVRPGFNPHQVLTTQIWMAVPDDPNTDPYKDPTKRVAFYREVMRRVRALPGVGEAAFGSGNSLPLAPTRNSFPFTIENRPADSSRSPIAEFAAISPEFFQVMQTPLLSGRGFTEADGVGAPLVAIIDRTLAERYWPGDNPLGKRISFGPPQQKNPWRTIVGVVASVRTDAMDAPIAPHIYFPEFQFPTNSAVIFVRTSGGAGNLGDEIRGEVQAVDSNQPTFGTRTMDEVVSRSLADRRFALQILGVFAIAALLLAAIGIYGVMAYSFNQRTHEIGIRMALGAQTRDILRMAVREGMLLVAVGTLIGIFGAVIVTRYIASMLFNVNPADFLTFSAITLLLAAAGFLACYIPARRTTRVDPLAALRDE